jgi:hypothetical protein
VTVAINAFCCSPVDGQHGIDRIDIVFESAYGIPCVGVACGADNSQTGSISDI